MFNYQKKYSADLFYQFSGSILFIILAFIISRPTANNDIYNQLIATEGILTQLDFTGVGQHPWGIASIASLLRLCSIDDPLLFFYYIQPFLVAACFCLLFKILSTVLPNKYAFFISLSSLSSLVLIKSMHQVSAEIISLATVLLLMAYVWQIIIQNHNLNVKIVSLMVILSWIAILCRHTAMFIIIGILIFLYVNNIFSKRKFFLIGTIMLLPGVIKALFFYREIIRTYNLFSFRTPLEIIAQLIKHFQNFTEIILPYSLHLNKMPWFKGIISLTCLFLLLVLMRYSKDSGYGGNKRKLLGNYFFTIGISYYCILSFASVYYNYDWGALYRVSGFGLLFMLNAFWIYIFTYVNWRKYILVILIISSITKVSYGLRYEILSNQHRFLFQDYRESIKAIIDYTNKEYKDIYVYIDKSGLGRNLYYMLLYYDLIYSLPFDVNKFSNNIIKSTSVIFCTEIDLNQFNSNQYSINKITGLKQVYAIQQ